MNKPILECAKLCFTFPATKRCRLSLPALDVYQMDLVNMPETVVVFAMLIYDNVIEIANNRDVIFNFAP